MPQYNNAPAFQLYAGDLLADPAFLRLTFSQRGAFFTLLMYLWVNGGSLHIERDKVQQLLNFHTKKRLQSFLNLTENKFIIRDNIITCPMLNEQIQKQMNYRLRASEYGHKGAKKRWGTPLSNHSIPYSNLQAPNSIIYQNNFSHHSSEGNTDGHTASTTNTTDTRDVSDLVRDSNANGQHRESGILAGTAKPLAV